MADQTGSELVAAGAGSVLGYLAAEQQQQDVKARIANREAQVAALNDQQVKQAIVEILELTRRLRSDQVQEFLLAISGLEPALVKDVRGHDTVIYASRPAQAPASESALLTFPPAPPLFQGTRVGGVLRETRASEGQLNGLLSRLFLPEFGALILGTQLASAPTAAQLQAIHLGMQAMIAGWSAQFAAGVTTAVWNAALSPALADSALDAPWQNTFVSTSAGGNPTITTATNGGIVTGASAASVVFRYVNDSNELHTVRAFALTVTAISSAAAGALFSAYLPLALIKNRSPKVHIQVYRATLAAAGVPYVSAVGGGASPYFTVSCTSGGTNSQVFDVYCYVSE